MNFFEHQQLARRKTRRMIFMFVLSVMAVMVAVAVFFALCWAGLEYSGERHRSFSLARFLQLAMQAPAGVLVFGAVATLILVVLGSLKETWRLRAGGSAVARFFSGREVQGNTTDHQERQLLNVVEEMAIASGTRMPQVFIMDEESSINAFAAGHGVSDAVIVVTRGLLDTLNRDELQGVIGHEFSHILNGDMSLNMRMTGVLAGIVAIGSIGLFVMRMASNSNRNGLPFFVAGALLTAIGYTGLFCARMIKAAVSREREFLADASSVQFTRNPDGIAGALDQIRVAQNESYIYNRYAEDVSHMFFGQAIHTRLTGLFDTHPPIEERIKRVNPRFKPSSSRARPPVPDGAPEQRPSANPLETLASALTGGKLAGQAGGGLAGVANLLAVAGVMGARGADQVNMAVKLTPGEVADMAGSSGDVAAARQLLDKIPPDLRKATQDPDAACAMVMALLLAPKQEVKAAQIAEANKAGAGDLAGNSCRMEELTRGLPPVYHLPLIDIALPAIKSADADLKDRFLKGLKAVIYADRRVSPREFVVMTLIQFQVSGKHGAVPVNYKAVEEVRNEVLWLLSLIAYAGCHGSPDKDRQTEFDTAFGAGTRILKLEHALPAGRDSFNLETAEPMLTKLRQLAPLQKSKVIQSIFACIMADGKIRVIEAELMRMICAVLDCPLPPLFNQVDSGSIVD